MCSIRPASSSCSRAVRAWRVIWRSCAKPPSSISHRGAVSLKTFRSAAFLLKPPMLRRFGIARRRKPCSFPRLPLTIAARICPSFGTQGRTPQWFGVLALTLNTMEKAAAAMEGDRLPRRAGDSAEGSAQASQMRVLAVADSGPGSTSAFKVYVSRTRSTFRQAGDPQLVWKVAGRGSVAAQRVNEATPVLRRWPCRNRIRRPMRERAFLERPDLARSLGWRGAPDRSHRRGRQSVCRLPIGDARPVRPSHRTDWPTADCPAAIRTPGGAGWFALLPVLPGLGWRLLSKASFHDTDTEAYRKILRAVPSIGRAIRDKVPFPKTRRVIFAQANRPPFLAGWYETRKLVPNINPRIKVSILWFCLCPIGL